MIREVRSFWQDEAGLVLIWPLVVVLLAVAVAIMLPVARQLGTILQKIVDLLQQVINLFA